MACNKRRRVKHDRNIFKKSINEKRINEYYKSKNLERSLSAAEMMGSRDDSMHTSKLSMASGTAFYEASFMISDI